MTKKKDEDVLTIKYVPLDTVARWDRNAKKHNIPKLIDSFVQHGFKDPMKYEPALNNGNGGIVEGNGRAEALKTMRNQNPKKPPRGVMVQEGKWLVPVIFGVDAKSAKAAEAYGVDANNLVVMGGDSDFADVMKLWEDQAIGLLQDLKSSGNMPVSVDGEALDAMLDAERERLTEREETVRSKHMLRILISVPAAIAVEVQPLIEELKSIEGVEVDISGN